MEAFVKVIRKIEVKYVRVTVAVRYGEEDIPNNFPLRKGDIWDAVIDIDSGEILGWPKGEKGELRMKVCDEGTYELLDKDTVSVAKIVNDYVPNDLLPGEYGDYIDLKIDENGTIYNWYSSPGLENFFPETL